MIWRVNGIPMYFYDVCQCISKHRNWGIKRQNPVVATVKEMFVKTYLRTVETKTQGMARYKKKTL